jgi:AcrR family transcriptional regulator
VAEADGWEAVTMRRLATEIGVTQPVLYSAFAAGRQAVIDAVALAGFSAIADALEAAEAEPLPRMQAYLDFAVHQPRVYEAMFSMPSGLTFGTADVPAPLGRAFTAIEAVFPNDDGVKAEVAWASLHGLATLQISGRLPEARTQARLHYAHRMLTS